MEASLRTMSGELLSKEKFKIHIQSCLDTCIRFLQEGDLSAVEDMASGVAEKIIYWQLERRLKELEGRINYLER